MYKFFKEYSSGIGSDSRESHKRRAHAVFELALQSGAGAQPRGADGGHGAAVCEERVRLVRLEGNLEIRKLTMCYSYFTLLLLNFLSCIAHSDIKVFFLFCKVACFLMYFF